MPRHLFSLALAALLGCSGAPDTVPPEAEVPAGRAEAPPAPTPVPAAHVALSGEGVQVVNAETGSTRMIAFGTEETAALDVLTRVLGAPGERTTNQDCGMGPLDFVRFDRGLLVALQDGKFEGWVVQPAGADTLRTMSNIGLGSTRAELEAVYAATIDRSTLGIEFMAGGLQGILSSEAADGRITDFWAGASCVAR